MTRHQVSGERRKASRGGGDECPSAPKPSPSPKPLGASQDQSGTASATPSTGPGTTRSTRRQRTAAGSARQRPITRSYVPSPDLRRTPEAASGSSRPVQGLARASSQVRTSQPRRPLLLIRTAFVHRHRRQHGDRDRSCRSRHDVSPRAANVSPNGTGASSGPQGSQSAYYFTCEMGERPMGIEQERINTFSVLAVPPSLVAMLTATLLSFVAYSETLAATPPVEQPTQASRQPTEDFATEFRTFVELSGTSDLLRDMHRTALEQVERLPENFRDLALREVPTPDDIVELMVPIYQRYFSLEDLQQLNMLYSGAFMREVVTKQRQLQQEVLPLIVEEQQRSFLRITRKLERLRVDELRRRRSPVASMMPPETRDAVALFPDTSTNQHIDDGETQTFRLQLLQGHYEFGATTNEGLDLVFSLWLVQSDGSLAGVGLDDDSGAGLNPLLNQDLERGVYYLAVEEFSGRSGSYELQVQME